MYFKKKIGHAAVDSGLLIIADPGYLIDDERPMFKDWIDFMNAIEGMEEWHVLTNNGGIVIDTPWGDGTYPVFVEGVVRANGKFIDIHRVIIEFEHAYDDDDTHQEEDSKDDEDEIEDT